MIIPLVRLTGLVQDPGASAPAVDHARNPALVYLASLSNVSRRTMRAELRALARRLVGADVEPEGVPWHLLRAPHTSALRAWLGDTRAPAGASHALAALRGVLRAAFRLELMTERDFRAASDLPPIRGARLRAGRALTAAELLRVFACAGSGPVGQRNAAALALLYGAGLRRAELCALDLAAVELATGTIRVAGKGRVERLVYVPAGAVAAVADWLEVRGREPGPLLWAAAADRRTLEARAMAPSAVYSLCSRVAARAGIPPFRPHDLRRTWAGDLLDAGLDLATVQALAGHRNVQTTAGYDRRAERTKMRARDLLLVPYRSPERPDR